MATNEELYVKTKLTLMIARWIPLMVAMICCGPGPEQNGTGGNGGGNGGGNQIAPPGLAAPNDLTATLKNDNDAVQLTWTSRSSGKSTSWAKKTWVFATDTDSKTYSYREQINNGDILRSTFYTSSDNIVGSGDVKMNLRELKFQIQDCLTDDDQACSNYTEAVPVSILQVKISAPTGVAIAAVASEAKSTYRAIDVVWKDNSFGESGSTAFVCDSPIAIFSALVSCSRQSSILGTGRVPANGTRVHIDGLPPGTRIWVAVITSATLATSTDFTTITSVPVEFITPP